jgi:hypothetical protein
MTEPSPRTMEKCPKCMKPMVLQHHCEPCCDSQRVIEQIANIMAEYHLRKKLLVSNTTAGELHNLRRKTLAQISQLVVHQRKAK